MHEGETLGRKMYSHSNKVIWSPTPPGLKHETIGIRGKIEVSLKERFKESVDKLHSEHKYERFIDNILMQHANEENIPVYTKHFSKKHSYRGYRIMKTEELDANPELKSHKSQKLLPNYSPQRQMKPEEGRKKEKKIELPLIFRFKKSESENGQGKMCTQRSQSQSQRELKLKQLKQKMILKYLRPAQPL